MSITARSTPEEVKADVAKHLSKSILTSAEQLGLFDQKPHTFLFREEYRIVGLQLTFNDQYKGWQLTIKSGNNLDLKFIFKDKYMVVYEDRSDKTTPRTYDATKFKIDSAQSNSGVADALLYSYVFEIGTKTLEEVEIQRKPAVKPIIMPLKAGQRLFDLNKGQASATVEPAKSMLCKTAK